MMVTLKIGSVFLVLMEMLENKKEKLKKMPIYEYECNICGKKEEKIVKMNEEKESLCPDENCLGIMIRKPSSGSFQFSKGMKYI